MNEAEMNLKRALIRHGARHRLLHARATGVPSRGRGKRNHRSVAYIAAFDHALGLPSAFPELTDKAAREGDHKFFEIAARAIADAHGPLKDEKKTARHVRLTLSMFINLDLKNGALPTWWEVRAAVEEIDPEAYTEDADWSHIRKVCNFEVLETGQPIVQKFKYRRSGNT